MLFYIVQIVLSYVLYFKHCCHLAGPPLLLLQSSLCGGALLIVPFPRCIYKKE